ncbi:hypothetical protein LCGC14_0825290 [marine sediment metagenome]|uniref:PAS domain S-box protein n=1 Tax=marine sediment metagenome TaxID=412755 RepID=A0A0F9PHK5_9ZZZZ
MAKRFKIHEEPRIPIDFYQVVQSSPEPILVISAQDIIFANKASIKLFGATKADELVGLNVFDIIHPDYREFAGKRIQKAIKEGETAIMAEEKVLRLDGTSVDVEVMARPMREGDGRLIIVAIHDITVQKKSEEEIIRSEKRFRALVETVPAVVILISDDFKILEFNPAAEKLYGLKREAVIDKDYLELFVPKEARDLVIQNVSETLAGKPSVGTENPVETKNGKIHYMKWYGARVLDEKGKPAAAYAFGIDVTEQKKASESLKASEERYRSLMDSAYDAIFLADAETGILINANKRAEELIGKPLKQIIGMHQMKLHPPELAEEYRAIFKEFTAAGGGTTPQLLAQHSSGRKVPIEVSANLVDVGGRKIIQGIFRDITERTRAKELSDTLNEINSSIHSTLNFEQIMQHVIVDSARGIGADAASITMREDDYWRTRYVYNLPQELTAEQLPHKNAALMRLLSDTKEKLHIEDAYKDKRVNKVFMKSYGIHSLLSVPLVVKAEVVGIISFYCKKRSATFSTDEIDFADKVAASVSLAIENANFYEAERSIADTLQEALLAIPKEIGGLDFSHLYRSATEVARVGGDFYDLFEIEHNKIGIIIGDVSGKGIEATSYAALVKNTVKAYAFQDASPASIMSKANKLTVKSTDPYTFVTLNFGILDTEKREIVYCNAGHPPPIVERNKSRIESLKANSPVIGIKSDLPFVDDKTNFDKNDRLVLYTDGVTEARSDGDLFGDKRLTRLIDDLKNVPTKDMASSIFNAMISFSKGKLTDDAALLIISLK